MNSADTSNSNELPFSGLVAFESAARLGSMSAAADALALTQSAVSQRIARLEAYVGQPLFIRRGRGVTLTGAGEVLLRTATETLQRLRTGLDRIEPYRDRDSLLLACPADVAQGWLMPRLRGLRAAVAGPLEVWLMDDQGIERVDRVDVDLIVSRQPRHADDLDCRPLMEDAAIAVCAPDLAAALQPLPWPRVLDRVPLLQLESRPAWDGLLDDPALRRLRLQRGATIEDERLLLAAAEQGLGIAQVGARLAGEAIAAGRLVALRQVPVRPRARLWITRTRLAPRTPHADTAFEWLRREAGSP